jgi:hypothetical protein
MSFVLALWACLAVGPTHCERVEFRVDSCGPVMPSQLVEWLVEHQAYRIARWSCGEGEEA